MADTDSSGSEARDEGLIRGRITDKDLEMMRARIGYSNPTLRKGVITKPWNTWADSDSIRRFAECIGDMNPLYNEPAYAEKSRWGTSVAPPGFEWSMGIDRTPLLPDDLKHTNHALRGVQLYHSGAEYFYHRPITPGTTLYKSECVGDVTEKSSRFATRSVIVNNVTAWWDKEERVAVNSSRWFVHAERKSVPKSGEESRQKVDTKAPARYSDEDLRAIEAAYDNEYVRGGDTLYVEDVKPGQSLPKMVKGPLTITDMINMHMGAGWLTYGNPPFRMAYENRKRIKGFYSKNEFGAWDTIQRVHWDVGLAHTVGVQHTYDIGPMRFAFLCHYLCNYAGDDAWVYRIRYELRNFNYVGDTTWLEGEITDVKTDDRLGPLVELRIRGINQRGDENISATATILVASRKTGLAKLPPPAPMTPYRRNE
jgi:acyl dehydratase